MTGHRLAFLILFGSVAAVAQQNSLDPAAHQASVIAKLNWPFLWLLGSIFVLVIGSVAVALLRGHQGIQQEPLEVTHQPSAETESKLKSRVIALTVATVVILLGLIVVSISAGKELAPENPKDAIAVEVMGNQWWWYVRYANDDPRRIVVTANEMHIPVGRPVMVRLTSNDVIHSFWVPNLHGKRDLVPGRVNTEWIKAERPGRYRGQCAEFCGLQHAHMGLWVVAEPEKQFEQWMEHQRQPANAPSDPIRAQGQQVFLNSACAMCHAISGTTAAGQVAPDLTHMGSRLSLAAGTLPNTKGNLAGWITDPQSLKPGNHMAVVPLRSEDVQPLIEFLEGLL